MQQISFVKEYCILEDSTGYTSIYIWSPLITQLKNNYSYRMNNVTVKNFQGNTFLSTSPFTTYTQQENTLSSEAFAKLCVTKEGADLRLTIFAITLENLFQQVSSVTLQNSTEEVTETLLSASNILTTFNPQISVSKMEHVLISDNQTS